MRCYLAAILLLLCGAAPAHSAVPAATPISRADQTWWRTRFDAKQDELRRHPELVFYGNSITQDYEVGGPPEWRDFVPIWQRFYGDRHAINLGFNGDATSHLLWRIEHGEAAEISPKVAIILIGANNLGRLHWSAEDTVTGIDAIVGELRHRLPRSKLLLIGILPSDRSAWATETTLEVNRTLAARYAHGDANVTFLDIGHIFMRNGKLDRELYFDPRLPQPSAPLHPTAEGQRRMAEAIEPTLASLLGDHRH